MLVRGSGEADRRFKVWGGAPNSFEGTQWEPIFARWPTRWATNCEVWAEADPGFVVAVGGRAPDVASSRHTPEPEAAATSLQIPFHLTVDRSTRWRPRFCRDRSARRPRPKAWAEALACAPTCAGRLALDTHAGALATAQKVCLHDCKPGPWRVRGRQPCYFSAGAIVEDRPVAREVVERA